MLKSGNIAPPFDKIDHKGRRLALDELVKDGPVVLYFYPKDHTVGCTKEACDFRDSYESLSGAAATVIGVSFDSLETHRGFAEQHGLQFSLISDEDKQLAAAYEVLGFFKLFPKRVTFVIGGGRKLLGVFHHELSMSAHIKNVRTALGVA